MRFTQFKYELSNTADMPVYSPGCVYRVFR